MNVFVIPSWYPDPRHGLRGGSFVEEAVHGLVTHEPSLRVDVSLWGQGSRELSVTRLRGWLANPSASGPVRPVRREVMPRLIERFQPVWTWRHGVRRGNVVSVLRAVREQFAAARAEHGTIHVLHAHVSFPGGYIAWRLSRETGIPFVITEHMGPFPFAQFVRGGKVVDDVADPLRRARRVTAVSESLALAIRERTGVEAVVIPNGVDEAFFTPGPGSAEGFTFLTVAALQPGKGVEELLRAIAPLGPLPGMRFRIGGDGAQAASLRALATRLGVAERVAWLGPLTREQVRDEMRACDAFVLTSRHESFGMVYAEALACGKPVIATRCGGPESIVREANGVLVPVGDVAAIAGALAAFAKRERRFDAAAIRADFEARFASRVVAARFMALYRQVAGVR